VPASKEINQEPSPDEPVEILRGTLSSELLQLVDSALEIFGQIGAESHFLIGRGVNNGDLVCMQGQSINQRTLRLVFRGSIASFEPRK
jgi:hypothetical protein